jgi:hypothetical protein
MHKSWEGGSELILCFYKNKPREIREPPPLRPSGLRDAVALRPSELGIQRGLGFKSRFFRLGSCISGFKNRIFF